MTKLEQLIKDLCPNGVEYKKLGEVCDKIVDGMHSLPKEVGSTGVYPILSAQNVHDNIIDYVTNKYVNEDIYIKENKRTSVENGDVLLTIVGAIGRTALVTNDLKALFQRSICVIKPKHNIINSSYLKYVLDSTKTQIYIQTNAHGAAQKGLYLKEVEKIKIPVPPIEIQAEIVKILDEYSTSVTALQQELEKELTARKKQYEYYRDLLLDFGVHGGGTSECEWQTIKLGDIGKISMCKRIMKSETSPNGDIPFYKIGTFGGEPNAYISKDTFEKYKSLYSFPKKGDILISAAGTIGRTVVYDGEPAYYQDSNIVWIDNDETMVLNRYLYYVHQLSPWQISTGGTIARLYNDNIAIAKINIPSLKEQEKIVSILDRFDKLCNDISEGLPAEIEARRKQYEYYRDKLLSFEEVRT